MNELETAEAIRRLDAEIALLEAENEYAKQLICQLLELRRRVRGLKGRAE